MAVYKVIQDIEAEDKLLGPLTLKGFIYAIISVLSAFFSFRLMVATDLGPGRWLIVLFLFFPMVLFGVLASPLGRQQPTEVWLLAKIRFWIKPRKRIWNQTGISHLVTVTAPKKIEGPRTKGLSQDEVTSRLQTLAATLDSRGWAIKNLNLQPSPEFDKAVMSDRLAAPTSLTQTSDMTDVRAADDIMDEQNNPTAQHFAGLVEQANAQRRVQTASTMTNARRQVVDVIPGANKLKLGAKQYARPSDEDEEAEDQSKPDENDESRSVTPQSKLDTPQPRTWQAGAGPLRSGFDAGQAATDKMTDPDRADKLELAQSGSDLSVASIAKLANRRSQAQKIGSDEVVISLH